MEMKQSPNLIWMGKVLDDMDLEFRQVVPDSETIF